MKGRRNIYESMGVSEGYYPLIMYGLKMMYNLILHRTSYKDYHRKGVLVKTEVHYPESLRIEPDNKIMLTPDDYKEYSDGRGMVAKESPNGLELCWKSNPADMEKAYYYAGIKRSNGIGIICLNLTSGMFSGLKFPYIRQGEGTKEERVQSFEEWSSNIVPVVMHEITHGVNSNTMADAEHMAAGRPDSDFLGCRANTGNTIYLFTRGEMQARLTEGYYELVKKGQDKIDYAKRKGNPIVLDNEFFKNKLLPLADPRMSQYSNDTFISYWEAPRLNNMQKAVDMVREDTYDRYSNGVDHGKPWSPVLIFTTYPEDIINIRKYRISFAEPPVYDPDGSIKRRLRFGESALIKDEESFERVKNEIADDIQKIVDWYRGKMIKVLMKYFNEMRERQQSEDEGEKMVAEGRRIRINENEIREAVRKAIDEYYNRR